MYPIVYFTYETYIKLQKNRKFQFEQNVRAKMKKMGINKILNNVYNPGFAFAMVRIILNALSVKWYHYI